eukprot:357223-Chlamydomonas_euryale.AAC.3
MDMWMGSNGMVYMDVWKDSVPGDYILHPAGCRPERVGTPPGFSNAHWRLICSGCRPERVGTPLGFSNARRRLICSGAKQACGTHACGKSVPALKSGARPKLLKDTARGKL